MNIDDMDEKTIEFLEQQKRSGVNINNINHSATGEVGTGSIYDADEEIIDFAQGQVAAKKAAEAPVYEMLDGIIKDMPRNSVELKEKLASVDYRLDYMKYLIDGVQKELYVELKENLDNFTPEASAQINQKLSNYLSLLATLKQAGYNFGSQRNSYSKADYDPYKPDIDLYEIADFMQYRRKNGAMVDISIPLDYDMDNPQVSTDAIRIINCLDQYLANNPNAMYIWESLGYVDRENTGIKR